MGVCCLKEPEDISEDDIVFRDTIDLRMKERNIRGKVIGTEKLVIKLPKPVYISSDNYKLGRALVNVQGVILPNIDPRQTTSKECQDMYFYHHKEDTLLACLFDGHGYNGKQVAVYCKEFMLEYFQVNFEDFKLDPCEWMRRMILECDYSLRNDREVDSDLSGTTAVCAFLTFNKLVVGNVGDSRCVIGTPNYQEITSMSDINAYKHIVSPSNSVFPIQVTTDHKPQVDSESLRIQESGGVVEPSMNSKGKRSGPFRVWIRGKTAPGIAISRSIGDKLGKTVGVIAEPEINETNIDSEHFIILGSDGVWDIFPNKELANFAEKFIGRNDLPGSISYPLRPQKTIVSHLIAEEARYRWLGLCEGGDASIDDISVVFIDITGIKEANREVPMTDFNPVA